MSPLALFLLACALVYLGTVESAFSAMMRLSLRLVAERSGRGEWLGRCLDEPLLLFVPVRMAIGVVIVGIVVLLVGLIGVDGARRALGLAAAAIGLVIACGHLIPLLIVRDDPERVLDVLLPAFVPVARVLRPLTALFVRIGAPRRDRPGQASPEADEEHDEAAQAYIEAGAQEGLIEGDERRLIQSIVDFGDTRVREVMTPRPDIVAIRAEATLGDLRRLLREQAYSRVPVYKESLDNILGVVFVKDLVHLPDADDRAVTAIMRSAYVVPDTKPVSDLLREFQRRRVQIAVVVDEYGGTAGLVTLEDLLEEIVGEIRDEYDEESEPVVDLGEGVFAFSGKVDIDDLADRLGVEIAREGFETVGGYLLARLGRVPAVGETLDIDGLGVEVLEAERRRVTKVRVRRLERGPEGTEG
jgi:CBS domain containing-hemolysin-like protein